MCHSMHHQTNADSYTSDSAQPIATGVIVHDSNRDRAAWHCRLWQYFTHHLLRGDEPRIWAKRADIGEVFYYGYDPHTGRSIHDATEAEIRAWLD